MENTTTAALALTALINGVATGTLGSTPAVIAKFDELAARLGSTGTLDEAVALHRKFRA